MASKWDLVTHRIIFLNITAFLGLLLHHGNHESPVEFASVVYNSHQTLKNKQTKPEFWEVSGQKKKVLEWCVCSFKNSFIYEFRKLLFSIYYVLSTTLGAETIKTNNAQFLPLGNMCVSNRVLYFQSRSFLNERIKGENEGKNTKDAQHHFKEMRTQTIMRYHLTSSRVVIIKMTENNKWYWEYGKIEMLIYCW